MVRSSYLERNFGQKTTLPFFSLFEGYSFLWSALSKMSYLLNPDITVGCIISKGCYDSCCSDNEPGFSHSSSPCTACGPGGSASYTSPRGGGRGRRGLRRILIINTGIHKAFQETIPFFIECLVLRTLDVMMCSELANV